SCHLRESRIALRGSGPGRTDCTRPPHALHRVCALRQPFPEVSAGVYAASSCEEDTCAICRATIWRPAPPLLRHHRSRTPDTTRGPGGPPPGAARAEVFFAMIQARRPTVVVVGTGLAGARVVEELLSRAPDRYNVRMFGAEPTGTYNRVLL